MSKMVKQRWLYMYIMRMLDTHNDESWPGYNACWYIARNHATMYPRTWITKLFHIEHWLRHLFQKSHVLSHAACMFTWFSWLLKSFLQICVLLGSTFLNWASSGVLVLVRLKLWHAKSHFGCSLPPWKIIVTSGVLRELRQLNITGVQSVSFASQMNVEQPSIPTCFGVKLNHVWQDGLWILDTPHFHGALGNLTGCHCSAHRSTMNRSSEALYRLRRWDVLIVVVLLK